MEKRYGFVCPNCSENVVVDEGVREYLLDNGCIVCETAVTRRDFTQIDGLTH